MELPNIMLISYGNFEKTLLDQVAVSVEREFLHQVRFREQHKDLNEYFDPTRRQYHGNKLLQLVDSIADVNSVKTIGMFTVDLFIPILTYIFGQAYLNGRSGIVSGYRLSNELYGLPSNEKLLAARLVKEINHELGHCFGLIHCHSPVCVMKSSTYVEDIDQKEEGLCGVCKEKVTGL